MSAKNGELNAWMRSTLGTQGTKVLIVFMTALLGSQGRMTKEQQQCADDRTKVGANMRKQFLADEYDAEVEAMIEEVLADTYGAEPTLDRFDLSTDNGVSWVVSAIQRLINIGKTDLASAQWETGQDGKPNGGLPASVQELVDKRDWLGINGMFQMDDRLSNACDAFIASFENITPVAAATEDEVIEQVVDEASKDKPSGKSKKSK